ncbi:MAG: HAMP domain-containing sensor histidine kinase [Pseudomonadota bacterium]
MSQAAQTIDTSTGVLSRRHKAIVAVLALLPVVLVLLLSLRGLQGEALRKEAELRATATRLQRELAGELEAQLMALATGQWRAVERILDAEEEYSNALRGLVTRRSPELALVYEGRDRVYPPRDSVASTPGEVLLFNRLSSQVGGLVSRAYADGESWRWLYFDGLRGFFLCRRLLTGGRLACALIGKDDTDQLMRSLLTDFEMRNPGWRVALIDATGEFLELAEPGPAILQQSSQSMKSDTALEDAMAGWRLSLIGSGPVRGESLLWTSPYILAGIPLCAFWLLLVWHFYQRQAAELSRSQERVALAAFLSHDLRTPLANVRLYSDLIRREADDNAKIQSYADVIEQELARLDEIAGDTVELARGAQTEKSDTEFAPDTVIAALLTSLEPKLAAAGISVEVSADASHFKTERSAFERVVFNLIENACKFAPNSLLQITARTRSEGLELVVRDHGPGLAAAPEEARGSGLGLKSVRAMLDENGGSLRLDDAEPGLRVTAIFRGRAEA